MDLPSEIPDHQIGFLFTQVFFLKQRLINAALKELNLTYIQFAILAGTYDLGAAGETVTQQTLATKRRLDKAMVSTVVKVLVERELMVRQVHPSDKRAYVLTLTAKGIQKAVRGKEIARKTDQAFFSKIDKKGFYKSLSVLLENEETCGEEGGPEDK